jgi:hypothetical protein
MVILEASGIRTLGAYRRDRLAGQRVDSPGRQGRARQKRATERSHESHIL